MLNLGCTYLIVKDMDKSIAFYEELLEMKVSVRRYDRWAQFDFGKTIALLNPDYDRRQIAQGSDLGAHYSSGYLAYLDERQIKYGNNIVLNLNTDDLNAEYLRIRDRRIGKTTEIMYLNISSPYYLFLVEDPDGNTVEITGDYLQEN
ncbi:VOC family protein [Pengzhenrongella phosphoraccumulans]|uniref:VOC family protein n=1 Tax=Pengzhenrongella phosphoraccumulans TaxID=3114394 RepID=UPI00388F1211